MANYKIVTINFPNKKIYIRKIYMRKRSKQGKNHDSLTLVIGT